MMPDYRIRERRDPGNPIDIVTHTVHLYSMPELTERQREVLGFIQGREGGAPSVREIARFLKTSVSAAADHIRALKHKGILESVAGQARSLRVKSALAPLRHA